MKLTLGWFVFCFIAIKLISCQNFPTNYETLWDKFTYKIESTDCNVIDFKKPFPKCENIFGTLTIPDFIKASSNIIVNFFTSNNKDNMYKTIYLFCKAVNLYKKCMKDANKACAKNAIWKNLYKLVQRDHPVYRVTLDFCKNGKLSKPYAAQKPKVDTKTCLQNTLSSLTNGINHYNIMISKMKGVFVRDPSKSDSANANRKLTILCSVAANLKRLFAIVGKSCTKEVQILLFKLTQWIFPLEINGKCNIPNDNPKVFLKSYDNKNKNRITVYIFGGFHKYRYKETTLETCTFDNNENVTIIELDKLQMVCTAGALSKNYTYIKSCSVTFYDDKRNIIDSLDYSANGVMSKTFILNGGTSIGPKSIKGKGKAALNITLKVVNPQAVRIYDKNTGVSLAIILFTSKQKVNIYSIVLRLTMTASNSAIGQFSRPCANSIKLGNKRRRRAASPSTTSQANYDATNLNDTNAKTMSSNTLQETSNIVASDSIFTKKGVLIKISIFVSILPSLLMILYG